MSDLFGMSDDDLMKMPPPEMNEASLEASSNSGEENIKQDSEPEMEQELTQDPYDDYNPEQDGESEDELEQEEDDSQQEESELDEPENDDEDGSEQEEDGSEVDSGSEHEVDFKQQFDELMAPLKRHGKPFEVKSIDEARRLMSMGIDYAQKTKELKEQKKYLAMLNKHDMLDETKLSYAIDLINGKPEAVAQLVKEKEIDTYQLNTDEESKYTPSNYSVTDSEVELEDVMESIRSSTSYSDTMNLVGSWDETSKQWLATRPDLLAQLNSFTESGVTQKITEVVERKRTFGELQGVSDIEAFHQVGGELFDKGEITLPEQSSPQSAKRQQEKPKVMTTKPKTKPKPDERRKKAAASKSASKPKKQVEPNWFDMTDEEILKYSP